MTENASSQKAVSPSSGKPGTSGKPGMITIARHGQPDACRETMLDWRGYEDWWDNIYQPSSLVAGQDAPEGLKAAARDAHAVYASSLTRAIETAQFVAPGRDLIIRDCLIEAELPPPAMAGRFMAKTWGVFARCSWWFGNSRGRESRVDTDVRADEAVQMLVEAAQGGAVVACAHGWFNRMMRPYLKQRGWVCVRDGGDKYWSYRQYVYRG